ncbi:MAG TPA: hypothetical protein VLA89_13210 [Gemmatimonadales bacterium]|nr:hypothetical protein [Gemmatimonadales bacterium]
MSELARAKKKLLAVRRAEQRLRQRLETIDWELDELLPEVEKLNELAAKGKLPQFQLEPGEHLEGLD